MDIQSRAKIALEAILKHEDELQNIKIDTLDNFKDRIQRWKTRVVNDLKQFISDKEASEFENSKYLQRRAIGYDYTVKDFMMDHVYFVKGKLEIIKEELISHPESILNPNFQVNGDNWDIFFLKMNPKVQTLAYERFKSGHYADAVEACFKEINLEIKRQHKIKTGNEKDGRDLMLSSFNPENPTVRLADDLTSQDGFNIQDGYKFIFAGSMSAIRNPKAHGNLKISPEEGIHLLFFASHLFNKLDSQK